MLDNKVLEGLEFAFGYLDDILIYSKNMEEHLCHVCTLFEHMYQADLKLTQEKMQFSQSTCAILRALHIWSGLGAYTRETREFTTNAPTHRSDRSKKISRICRVL